MKYAWRFSILLALAGCTTISVESVKDASYSGVLRKVYVFISTGEFMVDARGAEKKTERMPMCIYFKESIEKKFISVGIETRAKAVAGLESGKDQFKKELAAFRPEAVMTMQLKEPTVSSSEYVGQTSLVNAIYDIKIVLPEEERTIWRGEVRAEGNADEIFSMDKVIENIVLQLTEDGLIDVMTPATE